MKEGEAGDQDWAPVCARRCSCRSVVVRPFVGTQSSPQGYGVLHVYVELRGYYVSNLFRRACWRGGGYLRGGRLHSPPDCLPQGEDGSAFPRFPHLDCSSRQETPRWMGGRMSCCY